MNPNETTIVHVTPSYAQYHRNGEPIAVATRLENRAAWVVTTWRYRPNDPQKIVDSPEDGLTWVSWAINP